ncbi:amidohydrolase [Pseudodesulfovibrio mercurii]|uniref:Amidohydrolase n=1 Tax=Pseudodesulfovibrio mercurii TaxID=641491 RepID=F0JIR8_9BACT|nr:amidohydrolase family protein [Pseudodesulfovibrio mercurii]EGB15817.1 amidohydrolase [Pseudodesulfovibrio mercurii]
MRRSIFGLAAFVLLVALASAAFAEQYDIPAEVTLFKNVNIFDGEREKLLEDYDVLVVGNRIKKIAEEIEVADTYEIDVKTGGLRRAEAGKTHSCDFMSSGAVDVMIYDPVKMERHAVKVNVIDGKGRTLMPGLIDAHWHTMFAVRTISTMMNTDLGYLAIAAAEGSRETLLRGFTTVRDAGGNVFGVKRAIDEGLVDGPRIYPSGPYIGQTSGHGDFRGPNAVPEKPTASYNYLQRTHSFIADGVPEVIKRTREILRMGASQIKAHAGGGVSSAYDPLDVTEYTFEEAKAVCDVARTWNTYVMIHVNTDAAIRQWVEAGAMSVEHGFFIEKDTAKLMARKGVWWSMQPLMNDEDAFVFDNPRSQAKYEQAVKGLDTAVEYTKKYKVKTAFGTDMLFDPALAAKQGKFLAKLKRWYTPFEALKMATRDNAELLKLCGPRDPYPGELGVVREGALADLILVEGNPLENLDLVADPDNNFLVIMKDGKIYKNTVH